MEGKIGAGELCVSRRMFVLARDLGGVLACEEL